MAFLSNLFSRAPKVPLPALDALLEARGIPVDLPGLEALRPDYEHLESEAERVGWAEAVAALHGAGVALPRPWTEALEALVPELLPAWQAERDGCFHRPVADGLSQRIRTADRVAYAADLKLWHVDRDELLERALDHLRARSQGHHFERLPSGVYRATFGDGLDATRLLLPELWSSLFPGQNTFVTVPRLDTLLVAPQVLLPKLVDATGQALKEAKAPRILGVLYQWVDKHLVPANLQDPHPMAQSQRELRQHDLLEALAAQDRALGEASLMSLISTQQGRTLTMASWVEGRPVLLPEADLLAFMGAGQEPKGIYLRQTLPRIPELKGSPVEIWGPRRQRYDAFPTDEQLARLESFATAEQMRAMIAQAAGLGGPKPAPAPAPAPSPVTAQASPRPAHLQGVSLGVQDDA